MFNIKTFKSGNLLVSNCPIHAGDNSSAFNVNVDINSEYCGRWFCNTKGCHKEYGGDELGLLRGLMCKDEKVSFTDVIKVAEKICGEKIHTYNQDNISVILGRGKDKDSGITREQVRSKLKIPSSYYIDRGFSREVLDEFDVGLCDDPSKEMYNRIVFPIYNISGKYMAGCVGRTIVDDPMKWKIQKGFKKSEHIYGYAKALPEVCRSGKIILVEGQGDYLKLWMSGIRNVFGMLGSQISSTQELLLQRTGAMDIITFVDNDAAGDKFRASCDEKLKRLFNIEHKRPTSHDAGDMTPSSLRETLRGYFND